MRSIKQLICLINLLRNILSSTISTSPACLEIESSSYRIHIQNLSCKVEVFLYSGFHRFRIHFIRIHASSGDEFISRTTFWECDWDSFAEKFREFFSLWPRNWCCKSRLNMRKIICNKYFYKATRKFFCEDICDEFFRMILELVFQEFLPRSEIHIRKGSEVYFFRMIFIDSFPGKFWWENKCKRSRYSEMGEEKWSGKFYFLVILDTCPFLSEREIGSTLGVRIPFHFFTFSREILASQRWQRKKDSRILEGESRELMHPRFSREKTRKRRSEGCDCMSETFCESISITRGTCMSICISPCRNHENIWFIGSLWSGDAELF